MKKYIYLDIDGVITNQKSGFAFDPACLENLRQLVEKSEANVIIISSWREDTLKDTVRHMPPPLKKMASAQTPLLGRTKEEEIRQFLFDEYARDPAPGVFPTFIIIDDEKDTYGQDFLDHYLILTDIKEGLTKEKSQEALALLEEPWTCTDPDTGQYCRIRTLPDGHREYDYEEMRDGVKITDTIDVSLMTPKEIQEAISGYYKDLDEVKQIYGDDWEQIVAECEFEQQ